MEAVADFIFLGFRITADSDFSHDIKRCLLLGGKAMTNLDSILKSRDISLPTKVHISNQMTEETINQSRDDPKENRPGREGQKFNAGTSLQSSG